LGLRFAALERKFGEIDRARAIFIHISQFADPRGDVLRLWTVRCSINCCWLLSLAILK